MADENAKLKTQLNSDLTHSVMPNYSRQTQVSLPYTASQDGWLQCIVSSYGGISSIKIDGATVFNLGQTLSSQNYVTNFVTVPIAKGQTVNAEGAYTDAYFVPCMITI